MILVDALDVMVGLEFLRHERRILRLVERRITERDGARLHRMRGELGHHRNHRARVHASREERSERHVGHHLEIDGVPQTRQQLVAELLRRGVRTRRKRDVPVLARGGARGASNQRKRVAGSELRHAFENRARVGHITEREVLLDRGRANPPRDGPIRQDRLELRAEQEPRIVGDGVIEGLDAETVAREKQR